LVLIVLLLLVAFGYFRGRNLAPAWTNIPLIALAILSIGPSVCAVILYLSYKSGLIEPRSGHFDTSTSLSPLTEAQSVW
jgi:hypothetical protein